MFSTLGIDDSTLFRILKVHAKNFFVKEPNQISNNKIMSNKRYQEYAIKMAFFALFITWVSVDEKYFTKYRIDEQD